MQARDAQVTLTGVVASLPQKIAAGEDAVNASGIWLVQNLLQVRRGAPYTDAQLQAAIEHRLREHPYTASAVVPLRVDVVDGAVVLSGKVESHEVARVASFVPGVLSVKDATQPEPSAINQRTDADIQRDVERELRWDPRVEAPKLSVQAHDGVVTVSGTVANSEMRNAALEDVYKVLPRAFDDQVRLLRHAELRSAR